MIVAWQFIAWNQSKSLTRPIGCRVIDWPRVTIAPKGYTPTMIGPKNNPSYRTLRDGLVLLPPPGNELPGYDHVVPAGQNVVPHSRSLFVPLRGYFFFPPITFHLSHLTPHPSHPAGHGADVLLMKARTTARLTARAITKPAAYPRWARPK